MSERKISPRHSSAILQAFSNGVTPRIGLVTGTGGQGINLYRELLKNMAIRTRPEGGAFTPLLEHWMNAIQEQVMHSSNLSPDDPNFSLLVQQKVQETLRSISALSNSFDFARALYLYWHAYQDGEDAT